jgi:hypothetical protein
MNSLTADQAFAAIERRVQDLEKDNDRLREDLRREREDKQHLRLEIQRMQQETKRPQRKTPRQTANELPGTRATGGGRGPEAVKQTPLSTPTPDLPPTFGDWIRLKSIVVCTGRVLTDKELLEEYMRQVPKAPHKPTFREVMVAMKEHKNLKPSKVRGVNTYQDYALEEALEVETEDPEVSLPMPQPGLLQVPPRV